MAIPGMELLQTDREHRAGTNTASSVDSCAVLRPALIMPSVQAEPIANLHCTAQSSRTVALKVALKATIPISETVVPGPLASDRSSLLRVLDDASTRFHCPGESHPVSFSVHVARQASGFAACRSCSQNSISGHGLSARPSPQREHSAGRSLITREGIRGLYLNELDRIRATDWSAAFASILWDEQPRVGRTTVTKDSAAKELGTSSATDDIAASVPSTVKDASSPIAPLPPSSVRRGPVVVMGFDERSSSPDIVMGVALGLRRMGCHVIDLGQTTSPCFHFAVHHLDAVGGVFVTGAGCDPAWTGFRLAGRTSIPWIQPELLQKLESRATAKVERPTRTAGVQRPFHASVPYQAGLWKFFHALRPLNIVCGTATRQLPRILDSLFSRLPCQLTHEPLPTRKRNLGDPQDADVRRVTASVVARQQHLGVIVDDDGERCAFVTDQGEPVSICDLARLLVTCELHEHREIRIALDESLRPESQWLNTVATTCQVDQVTAIDLPATILQHKSNFGITADHRVWFGGDYPACDAILTLARVLQALSLTDVPMSEIIRAFHD